MIALLLTGLLDLGYAAYEFMEVQAAAEAGAQYAALNSWNATVIATVVAGATGATGITAVPVPSQFCACPAGTRLSSSACNGTCAGGVKPGVYAQISAQKQHWTILPYPGLSQPLIITGQALRRIQ